ncbi:uncharacterized protein LOC141707871 [Apium graveolens]|uniref:uncharacterized protein LOC141707871 n=1 Tax=Apium graveolens TaxID=4045 RepID=UPI003D799F5E
MGLLCHWRKKKQNGQSLHVGTNFQFQFPFPPFLNPQFETQQTPTNSQNSPRAQVSAFGHEKIIDLNDDCEETEDLREITGQWRWVEDKLLISAWLNVSIDPLVGTDQKAEAFWERIHKYCEEDNPGVIKRGVVAMKKRWQRINEGAQKFGACYDEAQRKIGSGSNLDNIIEKAHQDHLINYKKNSNFELHWRELRRHPKWRTPPTSASSKRTKISSSRAYSSEGNSDTPTSEEFEPVRPSGTKATTKRKGKGKARVAEVDEWESLQINHERKMDIMDKLCPFFGVASSDLWIWHAFFGVVGSNNDINVLDRSPVFDDLLQGRAPKVNYTINANNYNMGYYLTDGIYPEWATFVKTIPRPQNERDTYATKFGPLPTYDDATNGLSQPTLGVEPYVPYETYIQNSMQMRDRRAHRQLQNDLVEHISQFNENR